MKTAQQQSFSIKCECSAYRIGVLITSKKKSKISNITLSYKSKAILIIPLNSKDEVLTFDLKGLKNIHQKFVTQGKITLEFDQNADKTINNKTQKQQNKFDTLSRIFVESASPQNLQIMIKKIVDLKKEMKAKQKCINKKQTSNKVVQIKHTIEVKDKYPIQVKRRQPIDIKSKQPMYIKHKQQTEIKRRQTQSKSFPPQQKHQMHPFMQNPSRKSYKSQIFIQCPTQPTLPIPMPSTDILQLHHSLLQLIFSYTLLNLNHRLINTKFDLFTLRNLKNISFRDQVDDATFNKLAKYAIVVRGRIKNVRNLGLVDRHRDQNLGKGRAKQLFFGHWKEISKKNMLQLKGLKIHTLQLPYLLKFQFFHLYGLNLRALHLASRSEISSQPSSIRDQDILYLLTHMPLLQSFIIPHLSSVVLEKMSQTKQIIQKLRQLQIGTINLKKKQQNWSWSMFHQYQQLKRLKIVRVLLNGEDKALKGRLTFPKFIQQLEVGDFLHQDMILTLPSTLVKLKLTGNSYLNSHVSQIFLPQLKVLDISQCNLVRPQIVDRLQMCSDLRIITNFQKQDIDYWRPLATQKKIQQVTVRNSIRR